MQTEIKARIETNDIQYIVVDNEAPDHLENAANDEVEDYFNVEEDAKSENQRAQRAVEEELKQFRKEPYTGLKTHLFF